MKKSILFLTLLMSLSGFASLQAKVGWKRAWQCRNLSGPKSRRRLSQNKCTLVEIEAGRKLLEGIYVGGTVGTLAGMTAAFEGWAVSDIMKERRRAEAARVEGLEREGRAALEDRPESPLHQPPPKK